MSVSRQSVHRLVILGVVIFCLGLGSEVSGQEGFSSPPIFQQNLNDTRDGIGPCVPGHPDYEANCVDPDGDGPLEWGDGHQWTGNQRGLAFDSVGNYYVVDDGTNQVRKFDGRDRMVLKWTMPGGFRNDAYDVAVDSDDNVWVSTRRAGVIRKFDGDGVELTGGIVVGARINGIHIDGQDRVFVALDGPWQGEVRRYDNRIFSLRIFPINNPMDMVTDSAGNIWVTANDFFIEPGYYLKIYSPSGARLAAYAFAGVPVGIAIDDHDRIYLSNVYRDSTVAVFDASLNELFSIGSFGTGEGEFWNPNQLAFDTAGNTLYINDRSNARYSVFTSPEGMFEHLLDEVEGLVDDGALNEGQGNALIVKLEAALESLENGRIETALNQLEALRNQIEGLMQSGRLTVDEGQPLLDAVDTLLEAYRG